MHYRNKYGWVAMIVFVFWISCTPVNAEERKTQPEIMVDGKSVGYEYVDSVYGDIPAGASAGKAYRTRTLKAEQNTYLTADENGWTIKGQTWTETGEGKYFLTYTNTTGVSMSIPDGDYKVHVTYRNQGVNSAKLSVWDERGRQTAETMASSSQEINKTFTVSVLNNNLKLFFAANSGAKTADAGSFSILVKKIEIKSLAKRQAGRVPTIYILGDSSAHSKTMDAFPREGWGQEFYRCFANDRLLQTTAKWDEENLTPYTEYRMRSRIIENRAFSGQSTSSFWRDGKFDNLINVVKPGDYVLIQYGHNDGNADKLGYYTPTEDYKLNLVTLAKACKARGATSIFLSPTPRCIFNANGKIVRTLPAYKAAMKEAARIAQCPFVDVGKAVEDYMDTLGKEKARKYYMILKPGQYSNYPNGYYDSSHYNYKGARKAAQIIGVTLKESGVLPAKLAREITVESDYYKGISKAVSTVKVQKAKKGYKISWQKQKKAKYYKVYQYNPRKKSYKRVLVTKKNSGIIMKKKKGKKQAVQVKVIAQMSRR